MRVALAKMDSLGELWEDIRNLGNKKSLVIVAGKVFILCYNLYERYDFGIYIP